MPAAIDNAQTTVAAEGGNSIKPIDIGFRWYDISLSTTFFIMLIFVSRIDGTAPTNHFVVPDSDRFSDITIELEGRRPNGKLDLRVSTDAGDQEYKIKNDKERTIRRASQAKMYNYAFFLVSY